MYSLLIDTHLSDTVIVLYKDGKQIDISIINSKSGHSEVAMPTLFSILEKNKLDTKDINEIIAVNGPGSFTGVRIGVTIAKTLAYTLNIPIKTISALEVKAINIVGDKKASISDRNGKYVGSFNGDNILKGEYAYISNSDLKGENYIEEVVIDYNKVYEFTAKLSALNPHDVKPLYVKKIEVEK